MKLSLLAILLCLRIFVVASHGDSVVQLHGTGTTNPSKCFWNIMEELTEQAGTAVRLSYRAVGSTTGIQEFAATFNETSDLHVMFASGDIPVPRDVFEEINGEATERGKFVHLPIMAGAVSFFHSVPETTHLNLTACVLGQIFSQKLDKWGDDPILELNPNLSDVARSTPISVVVRAKGSSSTHSITNYLAAACSDNDLRLPDELVGDLPPWPQSDMIKTCFGSGGVTDCIAQSTGAIGYLEVGHGIAEGLPEVRLHNRASPLGSTIFRDSVESSVEAAISINLLPEFADNDFSEVTFLNAPGENTWPIVLMTYLYVSKDLSFIEAPQEQALLIAFLRSLYMPEYIQRCSDLYGFTLFLNNTDILAYASEAINMMEGSINDTAILFGFEGEVTQPIIGAGEFYFSAKRKEIADVERSDLIQQVVALQEQLALLQENGGSSSMSSSSIQDFLFGDDEQKQLKAALTLASLSFVFWMIWMLVMVYTYCGKNSLTEKNIQDENGKNPVGGETGSDADVAFG